MRGLGATYNDHLGLTGKLTVQILDTFRFESPLERLWTMHNVHLGLIGKRVVDFLLVLIELSSLGVTTEALRVNIG